MKINHPYTIILLEETEDNIKTKNKKIVNFHENMQSCERLFFDTDGISYIEYNQVTRVSLLRRLIIQPSYWISNCSLDIVWSLTIFPKWMIWHKLDER